MSAHHTKKKSHKHHAPHKEVLFRTSDAMTENFTPSPTPESPKTNARILGKIRLIILIIILVILTGIAYFLWNINRNQEKADYVISGEDLFNSGVIDEIVKEGEPEMPPPPTSTPTNRPTSPQQLAKGEQTYFIRTSGDGPKMTKLVINEFDPPIGSTQAIKVDVEHNQTITSVTAKLTTDTKIETINLTLSEGDAQKGSWTAQWPVADTHNTIYTLMLEATSQDQPASTVTLSFR